MKDEWFADRFQEISHSLGVIEEEVRGVREQGRDHEERIRKLERVRKGARVRNGMITGGAGISGAGLISLVIYVLHELGLL